MLIIANGTFKSGSTWQRDIIKCFKDFDNIPSRYRNKRTKTFLNIKRLEEFVTSEFIKQQNCITKTHLYHKKHINILINKPNVYIFMIKRDIRDTIVSHYHHFKNQRRLNISFKTYYWLIGRYKALQIIKYNNNWDIEANNVLHSSFEKLKLQFELEVKSFADFLNIPLNNDEIIKIKEDTNINKVKKLSNRKWFFRKGEIGEYGDFFSKKMLKDLSNLEEKIGFFDKILLLVFEIRVMIRRNVFS